ncbi:hypothetical protein [Nocardia coubleae]|uniref:Uncharacterized protein n=1 Tax=Nocardia coubleae TaxID=356147 RepID=A0A846W8J9_9NOCA|nr:hypothetical protein [Nocardia coubleae]NKX89173.1 hypothetical protein [Nocardia coubleae]
MSRRRSRPGRYRSLHVHGYRSTAPTPILWVFAAVVVGAFLFLAVLTALNMQSPEKESTPTTVIAPEPSATLIPPPPPLTPPSCYPFQPSC